MPLLFSRGCILEQRGEYETAHIGASWQRVSQRNKVTCLFPLRLERVLCMVTSDMEFDAEKVTYLQNQNEITKTEITVEFLKMGKAKISRVRYPLRAGGFNEHQIESPSNIATTLQCRTHEQQREVYCLE